MTCFVICSFYKHRKVRIAFKNFPLNRECDISFDNVTWEESDYDVGGGGSMSMSQLITEVSQLMWLLLWLSPLFHICHSISLTLSYRHSILTVRCFRCVLMGLLTLQLLCYGITASGWSDVTTILHIRFCD